MSNVLAIAGVTQLMKDLINDALINGDVSQALGADFTVTALPPDRVVVENGQDQPPQLNVFLHRVTPNEAMRNNDLPTRDRTGRLVERPRLALDLHYIVTAVAAEELHAEILLGYAMHLFHETAILSRDRIRAALLGPGGPTSEILPNALGIVRASELADQVELIKITPRTISMDDMSKMWTALQANYRTTVAYDVSVVLIERDVPLRPTTPVISRGGLIDSDTGRDPGVVVSPSLASSVPCLSAIEPVDQQPVMRLGGEIVLIGAGFDTGDVTVRFTQMGSEESLTLDPASAPNAEQVTLQLPAGPALLAGDPNEGTGLDPGAWRIGTYMVDVVVDGENDRTVITNSLPIALAPQSTATPTAVPAGTSIQMTCEPTIAVGQSVAMIVGSDMVLIGPAEAPLTEITGVFPDLRVGATLPVRLRVDGIDSPVIDRLSEPVSLITITVPA